MVSYDEKMVLNSRLVIKIEINRIRKNFVKSMSVKKSSYLGQFILGLRFMTKLQKSTGSETDSNPTSKVGGNGNVVLQNNH